MYLISRYHRRFLCKALCRFMSGSSKSHYEVLNLPRTCTDKEIKEAFIRLSKKLHPDKNKDGTHDDFVRVMEAYNVLGKPHLRKQYDVIQPVYYKPTSYSSSKAYDAEAYTDVAGNYGRKTGKRTFYDDFYEHRDKSEFNSSKPYYGMKGVRKRNNMTIVLICVGLASIGILIQVTLITSAFRSYHETTAERSKRNSQILEGVRTAAALNGRQVQSELLLKKITDASRAPIATAALAETLEKPNSPKDKQRKTEASRVTINLFR